MGIDISNFNTLIRYLLYAALCTSAYFGYQLIHTKYAYLELSNKYDALYQKNQLAQLQHQNIEQQLTRSISQLKQHTHEKINTLTQHRNILLKRLQQRTESRAYAISQAQDSSIGTTSNDRDTTVLHGEIGANLIAEAYRADVIRQHLLQCELQYEAIRTQFSSAN